MHVVATAGHVDHGKSTLVRALTGIDPDRWAEEQRRGLTIDLGFAPAELPSGRTFSFVDVPGHVRFLKNMLAGVGAVDAALLVVDAHEGWRKQTEEHVRIIEALGIETGMTAITKADLVDDADLELVLMAVAERSAGTIFEHAPVIAVDSISGRGLAALRAALDDVLGTARVPDADGRVRLWIDRSFSARGSGTVVTGTLVGGALAVGDELEVGPRRLGTRARTLQIHGRTTARIDAGHRVAINLAGLDPHDVTRGDAVVRPGQWHHTTCFDASLSVLASLDHDVSRKGSYLAYIGSGEHTVRIRVLGPRTIAPGEAGLVRVYLDGPVPLGPGDRYVLRESGRDETVGGGEILDVEPVLPVRRAAPDRNPDRVVAERGWVEADHLRRLTGIDRDPDLGRWVVHSDARAGAVAELWSRLDDAGELGLDVALLDERERAVMEHLDGVVVTAGRARRSTQPDQLADHPWVRALATSPFTPPSPDDIDRRALHQLVQRGLVIESDGVWFSPRAIEAAASIIAGLLSASPEGVTVAEIRDALGTSRKFVLPLVAHLDRNGITRRDGDLRVGGARLPRPVASGFVADTPRT